MAIALGNALTGGADTNNQSTAYASAVLTNAPGAGNLIILFVSMAAAASPAPTATVTGGGISTWTKHATEVGVLTNAAPTFRVMMFHAQQAGAGTTAALSMLPSSAATGCCWVAFQLTGTLSDTAGNGAGCFVQAVTTFNDSNAVSLTGSNLAAASDASNCPIAAILHTVNELSTPRANWTEIDDQPHGTPGQDLEVQIRTDAFETSYSKTWPTTTGAKSGAIAAEIAVPAAPAAASSPTPIPWIFVP